MRGPLVLLSRAVLSVFLFSALTMSASPTRIPVPTLSAYPDTESTTNLTFDAGHNEDRIFKLSILLNATASNNVVIAIGHDVDDNGILDRTEADLLVGWDSGRWFYHDRVSGAENFKPRENGLNRLEWKLILNPLRKAKSLAANDENGIVFKESVPDTMFSADWNLMQVTTRGTAEPDGLIVTSVDNWGIMVILR